ncbi:hypothetical protein KW792_00190 [Candidatus Saccharibacteria bacterium]|nr:hypothetical protein [Candidatus Saccharibacteria bacterium]
MKNHGGYAGPLKDNSVRKYYILTRPSKLSDLTLDDMDEEDTSGWREKSRQLQARRWRKIKHQLA